MPMIESTARICTMVWSMDAFGSSGSEKRRNPYVPIYSNTAARITEPAVGASTCASGNQVWKGNIGTLMAKPRKKAQKTHCCRPSGMVELRSDHGTGRGRFHVRVRQPGVEGEHRSLDGEAQEEGPEDPLLQAQRHGGLHQFGNLERVGAELVEVLEVKQIGRASC